MPSPVPPQTEDPPPKDSRQDLFPLTREVRLSDGSRITVHKWGIRTLIEMSRRIPKALQDMLQGNPDRQVIEAVGEMGDELAYLIAQSSDAEEAAILETWTVEDLLDVAGAVLDHCLIPVSEKIFGLGRKLMSMPGIQALTPTPTPAATSPSPSNTSSPTGTH